MRCAEEVTRLDLATAYNTLASGGVARAPRTIALVTDEDGDVLYEPSDKKHRVLPKDVAWTVVDVLRGVVESGTGTAAQIGRPVAGKTGTTQDAADAWFAGFTRELTTVTWMGYRDSNEPMYGSPTGGGFPAQLWADYMQRALKDAEVKDFPEPSGDYDVVGLPAPQPTTPPVVEEPEPEPQPEPEPSEPAPAPPEEQPSEPASDFEEERQELEERIEEELERRRDELRAREEEQARNDDGDQPLPEQPDAG